jgi:hypothetical protein
MAVFEPSTGQSFGCFETVHVEFAAHGLSSLTCKTAYVYIPLDDAGDVYVALVTPLPETTFTFDYAFVPANYNNGTAGFIRGDGIDVLCGRTLSVKAVCSSNPAFAAESGPFTIRPGTAYPTSTPVPLPTLLPSLSPTAAPSMRPTRWPTASPSDVPSPSPTESGLYIQAPVGGEVFNCTGPRSVVNVVFGARGAAQSVCKVRSGPVSSCCYCGSNQQYNVPSLMLWMEKA